MLLLKLCFFAFMCSGELVDEDNSRDNAAQSQRITFADIYYFGKQAYTAERYAEAAAFFEHAAQEYQWWIGLIEQCEQMCRSHHQHSNVHQTLCNQKCRSDRFSVRRDEMPDARILEEFDLRMPFSYMQYCYFELSNVKKAVSSAYTFLVRNPSSTMMVRNLNLYQMEKAYDPSFVEDLLETEYQALAASGIEAHDSGDYHLCVDRLELSLEAYTRRLDRCRLLCDAGVLSWSVYSHAAHGKSFYGVAGASTALIWDTLVCKSNCSRNMGYLRGEYFPDMLFTYMEYLHICYAKVDLPGRSMEAVGTALLLNPVDEDMIHNRQYYQKLFTVGQERFYPRKDVSDIHKRQDKENRVLQYFWDHFRSNSTPEFSGRDDDYNSPDLFEDLLSSRAAYHVTNDESSRSVTDKAITHKSVPRESNWIRQGNKKDMGCPNPWHVDRRISKTSPWTVTFQRLMSPVPVM